LRKEKEYLEQCRRNLEQQAAAMVRSPLGRTSIVTDQQLAQARIEIG
jgi:hypothetical protein